MIELHLRHIHRVYARGIARRREAKVLIAEAAAGVDDHIARGNAGGVAEDIDHRLRGGAIIVGVAPEAEI